MWLQGQAWEKPRKRGAGGMRVGRRTRGTGRGGAEGGGGAKSLSREALWSRGVVRRRGLPG